MTTNSNISNRCRRPVTTATRFALLLGSVSMIAGCATSFAPPQVELEHRVVSAGPTGCAKRAQTQLGDTLEHNIDGGIALVDNFVRAYRCAQRQAADGRQIFEVPSFLALAAAGLGSPLGMSEDASLVLGAGAAIAGRANGYYAPKQKAAVLDAALDAVLCIKTESVGVDFFETRESVDPEIQKLLKTTGDALEAQQRDLQILQAKRDQIHTSLDAASGTLELELAPDERADVVALRTKQTQQLERFDTDIAEQAAKVADTSDALLQLQLRLASSTTLQVSEQEQYFQMVSAALFNIDRLLAQRLSNLGTFDAAGLTAELSALIKARDEAKAARDAAAKDIAATAAAADIAETTRPGEKAVLMSLRASEMAAKDKLVDLSIKLLQPALQTCVVRAKL
jgi:hypothetical protein